MWWWSLHLPGTGGGTFKAAKNALLLKVDILDIEKPTEITNRQSKGRITVRVDLGDTHS